MCVANFAAVPHDGYRLGLPPAGAWTEVLNTDADVYAGSGVGNLGAVTATDERLDTASRRRRRSPCRRWPRSGSRPAWPLDS